MNNREDMEKLKTFVKEGREHLERDGDLGLSYVDEIVIPALKEVLKDLCLEIEERHKLDEPESWQENFVIHYTSIDTLVSMLQQEAKNKQNAAKNKQNEAKDEQESSKDEQNASLRLYDSVHFNDPDEGNYFFRNLNLPKKYDWLGEKKESHAYIASFIIPDSKRDMSDNLVFWRTYGREGEGCSLKLRIRRNRLRKVLYGADEVKCTGKTLRLVLDAIHSLVTIRKRSLKEKIREELAEAIWESLEGIRYLYKSDAYDYEHECRFIIPELDADKDKICFEYQEQNNSPRIRHYCEKGALKVKKMLISGSLVTLGPRVTYRSDVSNCLEVLRDRAGLEYRLQIKTSKISYRKF